MFWQKEMHGLYIDFVSICHNGTLPASLKMTITENTNDYDFEALRKRYQEMVEWHKTHKFRRNSLTSQNSVVWVPKNHLYILAFLLICCIFAR